jgi:hypothetical protein
MLAPSSILIFFLISSISDYDIDSEIFHCSTPVPVTCKPGPADMASVKVSVPGLASSAIKMIRFSDGTELLSIQSSYEY